MIIAIDGPAASGKGTVARALAARFGLPHLDTGLLYRAVGFAALTRGLDLEDAAALAALAAGLDLAAFDPEALKSGPVGEAASRVAALPQVRAALLKLQRDFAARPGGAVLDGRDIGTVIAPQAEVKIFVTASPEARAARRYRELSQRGEAVSETSVLEDIRRRDARDSGRASAPLVKALDAVELDNTALSAAESVARALEIVAARIAPPASGME
ncbi:(d)CMP kinase [Ancylobacter sp. MQZ15Z-1]|uniref:Cytidylate kinase n=1 Tax=Ancylobacter mangrovi TaxID=2972472 RepID=A0A9X2T6K8_9HYPH|nr:(d)CMP kinase [Ancylobacter mangrovi]MCS0495068.1 (d)CMP kinase [Ancylobacter mangrovi]